MVLSVTLDAVSSLSAALTSMSLAALFGSLSPLGTLECFFRVRLAFRTALAASARSALYYFFSIRQLKDIRCLMYSSPYAPSPRIACVCSPSGILILTDPLVVIIARPALEMAYGIGGR